MKNRSSLSHDAYLENLVHNLEIVGEDRKSINWIIKDGIWMMDKSFKQYKLADLVCVYYYPYASGIELKGSKAQKSKAKKQLESTGHFIHDVLGIENFGLKIVYYTNGNYSFENIKTYKGVKHTNQLKLNLYR